MQDWRLTGRVSAFNGEEGWHAGVNWQEDAGVFDLQLSGPLGQGAVQVKGKEGHPASRLPFLSHLCSGEKNMGIALLPPSPELHNAHPGDHSGTGAVR